MHGTLRLFPVFMSPIVWNMCEHLHFNMNRHISKSYTRSKNATCRAGAAVVSTITSNQLIITFHTSSPTKSGVRVYFGVDQSFLGDVVNFAEILQDI